MVEQVELGQLVRRNRFPVLSHHGVGLHAFIIVLNPSQLVPFVVHLDEALEIINIILQLLDLSVSLFRLWSMGLE